MAVRSYEKEVAALRALDLSTAKGTDEVRKVLRSKRGLVIAVAAKLVEEHRLDGLADELAEAFGTLVDDGPKRDPGCRGKLAIAHALLALDAWDDRVFVRGLSIVQREGPPDPGTGAPPVDIAPGLRGLCGLAHVQMYRDDVLDVLAALLADDEPAARCAAAQALAASGRTDTTALLRYKLLVDTDDAEVLAACFDALFALARDASADFAIAMLAYDDDRAEAAAIALGSARIASAAQPLAAWCEQCDPEQRQRAGYLALALLRTDEANALLLAAIRERGHADAVAAARALATFKEDAATAASLRAAITEVDAKTRKEIAAILDG